MHMKKITSPEPLLKQLDFFTTLLPFVCIAALCLSFVLFPDSSSAMLDIIRSFLGDEMGSYYPSVLCIWPFPGTAGSDGATQTSPSIPHSAGAP